MNWLTAIFGLLALYCLAGLGYTYVKLGEVSGSEGLRFWGTLFVACIFAAIVNEGRARRRRGSSKAQRPGEKA